MPPEGIPDLFGFSSVKGRQEVAAFDGGAVTSDAGARLLGTTDRAIHLVGRFAACFADGRAAESLSRGGPARRFADFAWRTLDSWSRARRIPRVRLLPARGQARQGQALGQGTEPALHRDLARRRRARRPDLVRGCLLRRGEMENRIKEQQLDLFAERTSAATIRANQLRLWFASFGYVLMAALRRIGLRHTQLANATCGTIRLKLLKLGALVRISVRRIKIAMASARPYQSEYLAYLYLQRAAF